MARIEKKLDDGRSIAFEYTGLKMSDFRRWTKAESEGDFETVYAFLTRYVVDWTLDGDPGDPSSYDELDLAEYRQVNNAASEWLQEVMQSKN